MSNNFTIGSNTSNKVFKSELKKLDREGVSALSFSELKYMSGIFGSMGIYQINGDEAVTLAHAMRKTSLQNA